MLPHQDAASLSVAILKKNFRGQIFLGCDNHPLSRLGAFSLTCQVTFWLFLQDISTSLSDCCDYIYIYIHFLVKRTISHPHRCCVFRQEMMDLVNKSGKFSKKFDEFTGEFYHSKKPYMEIILSLLYHVYLPV